MPTWSITELDATDPLREGSAPELRQAWKDAIEAVLEQLSTTSPEGCAIVMDGVSALLIPGRTPDSRLDLPATRAAAERMATAVLGGLG